MDARVARRSSNHLASSSGLLVSESTSSKAWWTLLFFASCLLPGVNGAPHDHDEERTILLAARATRYSASEIVHDKYFIPAMVSMGVLLIFVALCCFMLWGFNRSGRGSHDTGTATVWRPPLVNNISQSKSLPFSYVFLGWIRPTNYLFFVGRSVNGLNSRPPSRPLSGATSDGSLNRRPSKRKPAPTPHIHANLAPNASSPMNSYQSPSQTPGTYTPMQQFNTNMNGGVAPTQSHGFQQTQPQHQLAMSIAPSRVGGYYGQQDPRMSTFSSATSHTDTTQVGSGKTSPGAAGVGSGYGGGGSYFGATHAQQQAHPQNYAPSPHSYSQQQPQPQVYSQSQPQPQTYAQPQSYEYAQPQPQPSQNEQGPNDNKYGTYTTAEAYDGVVADNPSGKAPLKADSPTPVAGSSSNVPAQPPPNYANGDSKNP